VLPKIDALHAVVSVEETDVVCIVETWLSNDIDDIEIEIPRYDVVHNDRNQHGGGVCIYTSCTLSTYLNAIKSWSVFIYILLKDPQG